MFFFLLLRVENVDLDDRWMIGKDKISFRNVRRRIYSLDMYRTELVDTYL